MLALGTALPVVLHIHIRILHRPQSPHPLPRPFITYPIRCLVRYPRLLLEAHATAGGLWSSTHLALKIRHTNLMSRPRPTPRLLHLALLLPRLKMNARRQLLVSALAFPGGYVSARPNTSTSSMQSLSDHGRRICQPNLYLGSTAVNMLPRKWRVGGCVKRPSARGD